MHLSSRKLAGLITLFFILSTLILNACTGNVASAETSSQPGIASFTLKTGLRDGGLAFYGVGGSIDGQMNPTLKVNPGDQVNITLINGDGMEHDLSVPDLMATTPRITKKDQSTKLTFTAGSDSELTYYCTVPGHRQAGMEGKVIVGSGVSQPPAIAPSISRAPTDLPGPIGTRDATYVKVDLETVELKGQLADGITYDYWTFNGKVPGPFVRVKVGDIVEVHLKNNSSSSMSHSVDFHAVTGQGGGAAATVSAPGEETSFTFKALNPGLFVYHCATPMVAQHIANGMYGMIMVEPEGGLSPVDHEFYIMQGEIYTNESFAQKGEHTFSEQKLMNEQPEFYVFNGSVGALTKEHPLKATVGETVRIFFGVGGPDKVSSFHMIGEIFDRVFDQASLTSAPLTDVQTTLVPPGGATVVEFKLQVPGKFILVDHALSRLERGLSGWLLVDGPENKDIFNGAIKPGSGH